MHSHFADRVVVVTGYAAGLGRAIAEAFADGGATVVGLDRSAGRAEGVEGHLCDVSDRSAVREATEAIVARHARLDVLVNCAGVSTVAPFAELSESDWDRVIDVNLKGVFLCCQAALPHMLRQGGGAIVNLASQEGKRGHRYIAHHCAAKAGVINLTRALALEAAPHVRANCVCPGLVETDMVRGCWEEEVRIDGGSVEGLRDQSRAAMPLGRFQTAGNVADAVLFLASDAASEVTGEALNVSGGAVMH